MSRPLKVDKRGKLRLTEADVTAQCIDFLLAEGWEPKRQHVGRFIPLGSKDKDKPTVITIGEKGDPDWLVLKRPGGWLHKSPEFCLAFYLELKRPGGRLRPDQKLKHTALRQDGWLVCVASGRDQLWEWMAKQSLAREPDRYMLMQHADGKLSYGVRP